MIDKDKRYIPLKRTLEENASKLMIQELNSTIDEMNKKGTELNESIKEALKSEKNTDLTMSPKSKFNLNEYESSRLLLKKKTYHFPDILKVGSLVSLQETPSEIYSKNKFIHKIPFFIPVQSTGVAFLVNNKHKDTILGELESIVINMMSSIPDGLVKLTLVDKTGSGQNFDNLNRFNEKFVSGRVLSEDSEIAEEMTTIKNSMGNISQAITANGFKSVQQYNNETDEIPQRYNFIVINDFPSGFNKKSTENLLAIIESGYKSGMYVFMTSKFESISGFNQDINGQTLNSFLSLMTTFQYSERAHIYKKEGLITQNIEMIKSPLVSEDKFKSMVNSSFKIILNNESYIDMESKVLELNRKIKNISLKPMILLERLIPEEKYWYSKEASRGICVPFGKVGIENTFFSLGVNKDDEVENVHHGLICGMTGSGKTVLIHDIILMSCIYYSPSELQFHLLDYKEGTEFALYKDFPQVNILSMDSEIEFGHDVLQNAINEISRRGKLFKKESVSNLKGYNGKVSGVDKLPRIIIIIDEFQELFPKDAKISQRSNELFDDILRRGRSFGVNLICATQTLIGVDLEKQILSNMPLRVGLKMTEKDATKVFTEDNIAPKFLTDPGEGIYNNSHGIPRNNIPFQACNIEDERINIILKRLNKFMDENLSQVEMNKLLASRFLYMGDKEGSLSNLSRLENDRDIYIGEPVGLKKTHEKFKFHREFGDNLMILGGDQLQAISFILNLIRQHTDYDILYANYSLALKPIFEKGFESSRNIKVLGNDNTEHELNKVYNDYIERKESENRHKKGVIFFMSLIESSKILNERAKTPAKKKLDELILSGPEYGIHIIYYALDYSTLMDQDIVSNLSKFKKRVIFNGGKSEKILNTQIKESKSKKIATFEFGNEDPVKFKPYILDEVRNFLKIKEDD
ncbi:MAG TPA: hypothetical protein EYG89_01450 [Bacteroidia bacterium]|nr:hypothetical protein [Bacteroidia bacterium]